MNTQETLKKNFEIADTMMDKMWDMWLVSLGSLSWTQEQFEMMVKKYLEQSKTTREESVKVLEEMMQQVRKNQEQLQSMMQEAVKAAVVNLDIPNFNMMDDLKKKVDDLSKKVEKL